MNDEILTSYFKALASVTESKQEFDMALQSHRNRLTDEEMQEALEIFSQSHPVNVD